MADDEKPISRSKLAAWRTGAQASRDIMAQYEMAEATEIWDRNLRLIREVERLREALRGVVAEADRETVAFIKARGLLPEDDGGKEVKHG